MKLSCKDICFMVSESLDRKLPLRKRLGIKIHLLMCKACQQMARQMKLLRSASHRSGSEEHLSKEASERILKQLQHVAQSHNKKS